MQRSSFAVCAALLVSAIAAAPAAATPAPAPTSYTSGQVVPPALGSAAEYVFGSHYAKQLPTGTTALVWNLTLVEGQTTDLTMQCPTGTVVADINITGPTTGYGETTPLPDFTPWYGQNAPSVSFGTQQPGAMTCAVLCLPTATSTTTVVHGKSPVTFPSSQIVAGVKRGAKLAKGATVLKTVTTSPVSPGGTYVSMTKGCAAGTYQSQSVVSSPGSGGTGATGNDVILYPSPSLGSGAVTLYVLCAPPPKPQS